MAGSRRTGRRDPLGAGSRVSEVTEMRQRSKEFFEDLYWIAFAAVLVLLVLSLGQLAGSM